MLRGAHVWEFLVAALVIIVVPGPSVLFVIGRGIALGRKAAVTTVFGNALGALTCATAVSLGLGPIVKRSILVYNGLRFAGAAYLVYLGVQAFRGRKSLSASLNTDATKVPVALIIRQGYVVGVTNPKVYIFFAAVLPQYVNRTSGNTTAQMIVFGLMFAALAFCSDSAWGLLAGTVRHWLSGSEKRLEAVGGAGGIAIVGLGLHLALSGGRK